MAQLCVAGILPACAAGVSPAVYRETRGQDALDTQNSKAMHCYIQLVEVWQGAQQQDPTIFSPKETT